MARDVDGSAVSTDFDDREVRRPPNNLPVNLFFTRCDGCGQCIEVCPKGGIALGSDGYPVLVASDYNCGRCHLCSDVCSREALDATPNASRKTLDPEAIRQLIRAAVPGITARLARRA